MATSEMDTLVAQIATGLATERAMLDKALAQTAHKAI